MTGQRPERAGRIRAVRLLIGSGADRYDPNRHLDRLLGAAHSLWGGEETSREAAIAHLKRALRSERQRGRAGHWSYDLNRHIGLLQALKAERARPQTPITSIVGERCQPAAAAGDTPASPPSAPAICETGTETS